MWGARLTAAVEEIVASMLHTQYSGDTPGCLTFCPGGPDGDVPLF